MYLYPQNFYGKIYIVIMPDLYMGNKRTTINIDKEIRDSLNACKKYKRETYDEILKNLIKAKGGKR